MVELANAVVDFVGSIAIPIAHDIGYPHQEPPPRPSGSGGGASTVVILVGVVVTLAAVAGLVWLKQRTNATAAKTDGVTTPPPRPPS
jgi:hypothetical protein